MNALLASKYITHIANNIPTFIGLIIAIAALVRLQMLAYYVIKQLRGTMLENESELNEKLLSEKKLKKPLTEARVNRYIAILHIVAFLEILALQVSLVRLYFSYM